MKKYIHCYIADPHKIPGAANVQIDQMQHVPNGSCDIISFNESNGVNKEQLGAVIGGLSKKIKLNIGSMCLEYLNFDKICNDIKYDKIPLDVINKILIDKQSFFFEKDIEEILTQYHLIIKQVIYDGNAIKLTIQRTQ
jgi:hypothetical protein